MKRPPKSTVVRRSSRENACDRVCLMVFGAESATGVPRLQRPIFGHVYSKLSPASWVPRRGLRGFVATALFALGLLLSTVRAAAQATARFDDAPTPGSENVAPAAPVAAPPAPPTPSIPLVTPANPGATPAVGFTRRLALSHFERAELLDERGEIPLALREYSAAIEIDSTFGDAYLKLGALRERMGDPREADLVYSAATSLPDIRARALVQRSHLRRSAGLGADALRDLETAVELDEDDRALLAELAQDYVELHAWAAALAVFRRISTLASESGDARALESAQLEVRALRVLAAETDPTRERGAKHDWVSRSLASIARR